MVLVNKFHFVCKPVFFFFQYSICSQVSSYKLITCSFSQYFRMWFIIYHCKYNSKRFSSHLRHKMNNFPIVFIFLFLVNSIFDILVYFAKCVCCVPHEKSSFYILVVYSFLLFLFCFLCFFFGIFSFLYFFLYILTKKFRFAYVCMRLFSFSCCCCRVLYIEYKF